MCYMIVLLHVDVTATYIHSPLFPPGEHIITMTFKFHTVYIIFCSVDKYFCLSFLIKAISLLYNKI